MRRLITNSFSALSNFLKGCEISGVENLSLSLAAIAVCSRSELIHYSPSQQLALAWGNVISASGMRYSEL